MTNATYSDILNAAYYVYNRNNVNICDRTTLYAALVCSAIKENDVDVIVENFNLAAKAAIAQDKATEQNPQDSDMFDVATAAWYTALKTIAATLTPYVPGGVDADSAALFDAIVYLVNKQ